MNITYRKCNNADLEVLIRISRRTFVDAFEKDNNPEDFENYVEYAFAKSTILKQLKNPNTSFYFVLKEEQLVGYFKLNTNEAQTDIKSDESIELERIYVLQKYQDQQIGKKMLQEAMRLASELKKQYIWLGVWQKNTDAIRFYEKEGFSKFGKHPYYIGKDKQIDWLMRLELINFQDD